MAVALHRALPQHLPGDLLPHRGCRHLGGDGGVGHPGLCFLLGVHCGRGTLILPGLDCDGAQAFNKVLAVIRIMEEGVKIYLEVSVEGIVLLEPL